MGRLKNPRAGRGPCPLGCGHPVSFRKGDSGRLAYTCDGCDASGYADPGGRAHRKWAAAMVPDDDGTPAATPAAPAAAPKPAAGAAPLPFSL